MAAAIRSRAKSVIQDTAAAATKTDDGGGAASNRCLVYCRLRPTKPKELSEEGVYQLVDLKGKVVTVDREKTYDYDGTFVPSHSQEEIFQQVARPGMDHVFNGFRAALMCYGQTGTGKSFTMCNTTPGQEGLIPRAAIYLYERIAADDTRDYEVEGQFVQIYRDKLGDLMSEGGKDSVDIRFEKDSGVTLTGCSSHKLTSYKEFMDLYEEGNTRRVVTATKMNPESSRGHSALVVWVRSTPRGDGDGGAMTGKITFIDLAGYERFSKTGISGDNVVMKDEAKTINSSLLALGHVVSALSEGQKHIPWRNAKLTRLLQDSIGGKSKTTIILTIGPSSEHFHETTNSLQFGQRAMAVKVDAKASVVVNYEQLAAKLQAMLDEKDEKISLLEMQATARQAEREEVEARHARDMDAYQQRHRTELQNLLDNGAPPEAIQRLLTANEVEMTNLFEQQAEEKQYQEEAYEAETAEAVNEIQFRSRERARSIKWEMNDSLVTLQQQLEETQAELRARTAEVEQLKSGVEKLQGQVSSLGAEPIELPPLPDVNESAPVEESSGDAVTTGPDDTPGTTDDPEEAAALQPLMDRVHELEAELELAAMRDTEAKDKQIAELEADLKHYQLLVRSQDTAEEELSRSQAKIESLERSLSKAESGDHAAAAELVQRVAELETQLMEAEKVKRQAEEDQRHMAEMEEDLGRYRDKLRVADAVQSELDRSLDRIVELELELEERPITAVTVATAKLDDGPATPQRVTVATAKLTDGPTSPQGSPAGSPDDRDRKIRRLQEELRENTKLLMETQAKRPGKGGLLAIFRKGPQAPKRAEYD